MKSAISPEPIISASSCRYIVKTVHSGAGLCKGNHWRNQSGTGHNGFGERKRNNLGMVFSQDFADTKDIAQGFKIFRC